MLSDEEDQAQTKHLKPEDETSKAEEETTEHSNVVVKTFDVRSLEEHLKAKEDENATLRAEDLQLVQAKLARVDNEISKIG
ncbi:hypothetical protein Moror_11005 [Moniliophthora roreri MCA 2997]|uniref:Uncharacterized protein n=1 Tax=Moniliophthora roreri (strain MCA 2997) TaxID=1381753 RepID=V2WF21_MONRO|nr:hypothetical protein Moror_11005 [Moniliophthora roreri MCA 2997]